MAQPTPKITELDPVWDRIRRDANEFIAEEPVMGGLVHSGVLHHDTLEAVLSYRMALKLSSEEMPTQILRELIDEAFASDPTLGEAARADLVHRVATLDRRRTLDRHRARDPGCPAPGSGTSSRTECPWGS